ncbi:hypothetical protein [Actinokineospora inagensis]|uniref:hypothetical protein n=1 Tax=Actinokineospora inagensis TaxID=103730 RepID=UPI000414724C|nr:hypothetical protein [Actinokineospora inagensis]
MDFTPIPGPPQREQAAEQPRDEAIAAAVAGLDGLDGLPVTEHVDRFDAVHIALTAALATIDKV